MRKQSIAKKNGGDGVCSLTPTLRCLYDRKCLFLFLRLFSAAVQGLILFIFGLTWRDHLLLRTLKHKLADPLVAAIRKGITEGGSSVQDV